MQQGRADRASNASLTMANGELAHVWQRGMDADPTMTREEVTQWLLVSRSAFLSGEDSFLQYKAGTLDQAAFDSYCAGVRTYMSYPGFRAAWKLSATQLGKEFRAFVDAQVAATQTAVHVDIYAEWQKLVRAEGATPKN